MGRGRTMTASGARFKGACAENMPHLSRGRPLSRGVEKLPTLISLPFGVHRVFSQPIGSSHPMGAREQKSEKRFQWGRIGRVDMPRICPLPPLAVHLGALDLSNRAMTTDELDNGSAADSGVQQVSELLDRLVMGSKDDPAELGYTVAVTGIAALEKVW